MDQLESQQSALGQARLGAYGVVVGGALAVGAAAGTATGSNAAKAVLTAGLGAGAAVAVATADKKRVTCRAQGALERHAQPRPSHHHQG
jgi:glycerol-3-phosphate dehydrogenase